MTFTATDTADDEYTFINEGFWGPAAGFNLPADYSATTDWTLNRPVRTRMPGGVRGRGLAAPFYSIAPARRCKSDTEAGSIEDSASCNIASRPLSNLFVIKR